MNVYFTDYFGVSRDVLAEYGAFNVSLINDLPVFIDPFLLFNSEKAEYCLLHDEIIRYIIFLREMSEVGTISKGLLSHWFHFPEVKQNWLGYSRSGNQGAGLGPKFAAAMNANLATIFQNFGSEQVTRGSHLEKLCLIRDGVGKDNISDFTTNLIKGYLAEYTQAFANVHLDDTATKVVEVTHAEFNYKTRRWISKQYRLPFIDSDYVLLSPKDILTKDEAWINKHDIIGDFDDILAAIPNIELRAQIDDYLLRQIPDDANRKEINAAVTQTLRKYPQLIDYYIKFKEDHGDEAVALSDLKVKETEAIFIAQVSKLINRLTGAAGFYDAPGHTFDEAYKRVQYLGNPPIN